jgi:hypothetical protein
MTDDENGKGERLQRKTKETEKNEKLPFHAMNEI